MAHRETPDAVRQLIDDLDEGHRITGPEAAVLARRRAKSENDTAEATGRPKKSDNRKVHDAVNLWSKEAQWVALGLARATALLPPASRRAGRGSPSTSNPTQSQWFATLTTVERSCMDFAHIAGPCPYDGVRSHDRCCGTTETEGCRGVLHECPPKSAVDIAAPLGLTLDPTGIIDELVGTPPTATKAFTEAVSRAATWHSTAASHMQGAWDQARLLLDRNDDQARHVVTRLGLDPDVMTTTADHLVKLSHRMAGLAGSLTDWSGRRHPKAGIEPQTCACTGECDDCGASLCTDHDGGCDEIKGNGRSCCSRCRGRHDRHRTARHNSKTA